MFVEVVQRIAEVGVQNKLLHFNQAEGQLKVCNCELRANQIAALERVVERLYMVFGFVVESVPLGLRSAWHISKHHLRQRLANRPGFFSQNRHPV